MKTRSQSASGSSRRLSRSSPGSPELASTNLNARFAAAASPAETLTTGALSPVASQGSLTASSLTSSHSVSLPSLFSHVCFCKCGEGGDRVFSKVEDVLDKQLNALGLYGDTRKHVLKQLSDKKVLHIGEKHCEPPDTAASTAAAAIVALSSTSMHAGVKRGRRHFKEVERIPLQRFLQKKVQRRLLAPGASSLPAEDSHEEQIFQVSSRS